MNLHPKTAAYVIETATELKDQRDELLEAARLAIDVIGNTRDELGLKIEAERAYLALRAAIAHAEAK